MSREEVLEARVDDLTDKCNLLALRFAEMFSLLEEVTGARHDDELAKPVRHLRVVR